jgi:hypothetical protein
MMREAHHQFIQWTPSEMTPCGRDDAVVGGATTIRDDDSWVVGVDGWFFSPSVSSANAFIS